MNPQIQQQMQRVLNNPDAEAIKSRCIKFFTYNDQINYTNAVLSDALASASKQPVNGKTEHPADGNMICSDEEATLHVTECHMLDDGIYGSVEFLDNEGGRQVKEEYDAGMRRFSFRGRYEDKDDFATLHTFDAVMK